MERARENLHMFYHFGKSTWATCPVIFYGPVCDDPHQRQSAWNWHCNRHLWAASCELRTASWVPYKKKCELQSDKNWQKLKPSPTPPNYSNLNLSCSSSSSCSAHGTEFLLRFYQSLIIWHFEFKWVVVGFSWWIRVDSLFNGFAFNIALNAVDLTSVWHFCGLHLLAWVTDR